MTTKSATKSKEKAQKDVIRYATEQDIPQIMKLYKQMHWAEDDYDPEVLEDPNTHILVFDDKGKIRASAQLTIVHSLARGGRPFGVINYVITDSGYRRMGYMKRIFRAFDRICKKNNCYNSIIVSMWNHATAHMFYEAAGYTAKVKGFRKNYPIP